MNWKAIWNRLDDELDETVTWRRWWVFAAFVGGFAVAIALMRACQ